jgi:hypothetical protein
MARSAVAYLAAIPREELYVLLEALSSCAIEGNRVGEICGETLRRFLHGEGVSDRYVLGLAWFVREHRAEDAGFRLLGRQEK